MRLLAIGGMGWFLILFSAAGGKLSAQTEKKAGRPQLVQKERFWDRTFVGGNLGLQLGVYTYINLSPVVGYRVSDHFQSGVGLTYIFRSYGAAFAGVPISDHTVGWKYFAQTFVVRGFFIHKEFESLNYPDYDWLLPGNRPSRNWGNALWLGPGFQQNFGLRSFSQVMLLYNVIWDRFNTPYTIPFAFRFLMAF
ncbi:MAG: hypothetical protein N2110_07630 [Flavobacteriales bacterium]|nr:hypothetical protein [Flavobacteriales bacterium]MCX7768875.1 hypothetical protein [Flavobacteriales bacterium]MDW8410312.1 hypothetical protein [Flavobacteriales bacterium]